MLNGHSHSQDVTGRVAHSLSIVYTLGYMTGEVSRRVHVTEFGDHSPLHPTSFASSLVLRSSYVPTEENR